MSRPLQSLTPTIYLVRAFLRYHARKPILTLLCLTGVAFGVAALSAITLSNQSALKSFRQTVQTSSPQVTYTITAHAGQMDESVFTDLVRKVPNLRALPVIELRIYIPSLKRYGLIVGTDPLFEPDEFRETTFPSRGKWIDFLTHPFWVLASQPIPAKSTQAVQTRSVNVTLENGKSIGLIIGGIIPQSRRNGNALTFLGDISWVQRVAGMGGRLQRIDLIHPTREQLAAIRKILPRPLLLRTTGEMAHAFNAMLRSFELNLQALGLLSLYVGFFLIYNTLMFTVLQRRKDLGVFLSLGGFKREIIQSVLISVTLISLIGSALGLVLGYYLATYSLQLIGKTLSNIYAIPSPRHVFFSWHYLLQGLALGVGAGWIGALLPVIELSRARVLNLLQRINIEDKVYLARYKIALLGGVILVVSLGIAKLPGDSPYPGFFSAFGLCLSFSFLAPLMITLLNLLIKPFLSITSIKFRLSITNIPRRLSRTSPAIAALMVALSMSIGISVMIHSFRQTLIDWIRTNIQGDYYLSVSTKTFGNAVLNPEIYPLLSRQKFVEALNRYHDINYLYQGRYIRLSAMDSRVMRTHSNYLFYASLKNPWRRVASGDIIISESLANKFHLKVGDTMALKGLKESRRFTVAGIFRDFITEHGVAILDWHYYTRLFHDRSFNSLAIFTRPGIPAEKIKGHLERLLRPYPHLLYSHRQLKQRILSVFDQSFAITRSTRFIAVTIAFFGIISALLAIFLETEHEYGILRALGLNKAEVFGMSLTQALIMGFYACLIAFLCGPLLGYILIKVINLKSFGWTITYHLRPILLAKTLWIALVASFASGIYPAYRISQSRPYFQMQR